MDLSQRATMVSLDISQAADAAAQSAYDENQRKLVELAIQANEISQNMANAAATQQFITGQTQIANNAAVFAQSQAATQSAAQTAQAQAMLVAQATQTAQAYATQTAYSLTATPWAVLQANNLRIQRETERRALWDEFVVTPLKVILIAMIVLLLILGGVMAYRQLMPVLELRLRTISRDNDGPLYLVDGLILDAGPRHHQLSQRELRLLNHSRSSDDETLEVEIIGPSEPSIINWINEAEQKLHSAGGQS
jgi:hypothetical protein